MFIKNKYMYAINVLTFYLSTYMFIHFIFIICTYFSFYKRIPPYFINSDKTNLILYNSHIKLLSSSYTFILFKHNI
ncbi:hypothetical protein PFNF135_02708 [Plasmodium falciparum NF135/5.C10]|uniref:Uncharacterized protein n=1 Tax=Plasmodium falciparum NF135/5.C10 TaxID=1036726 RepID=W4IID3_PLAFA|nr:hypothetical protein PFNF135_02708 [Plasmodium falciparum NF135/5.C10]